MHYLFPMLALLATSALAGPTLTTTPVDPVSTHCGWSVDGSARSESSVTAWEGQKYCSMDIAGIMGRTHTVDVTVSFTDPVWGKRQSLPSDPYTVTPPPIPAQPGGLKIVP